MIVDAEQVNEYRPIVPKFRGSPSVSTSDITVDVASLPGCYSQDSPLQYLVNTAKRTFDRYGAVLITNTGLGSDMPAMQRIAESVMGGVMEYEGGANSRGHIIKNVYDTGAPSSAYLQYHHEMCYVNESVSKISFVCKAATGSSKGSTYLSENLGVTDDILNTEFGQKLKEKGICYIRCLTDREAGDSKGGVYNHWQRSFGTDDPAEVEEIARSKGLEVHWGPGRYMRTKHYTSGFEYFAPLDRNLLYSSIADHHSWFDTWPGVMDLPPMPSFEQATPAHRPLAITFGDGTPMTDEELRLFADMYDRHGLEVVWKEGDILVVCNYRYAHGRPSYELDNSERRELGVVLGPKFERVGHVEGKWTAPKPQAQ